MRRLAHPRTGPDAPRGGPGAARTTGRWPRSRARAHAPFFVCLCGWLLIVTNPEEEEGRAAGRLTAAAARGLGFSAALLGKNDRIHCYIAYLFY
jgi:hypothetical protein